MGTECKGPSGAFRDRLLPQFHDCILNEEHELGEGDDECSHDACSADDVDEPIFCGVILEHDAEE